MTKPWAHYTNESIFKTILCFLGISVESDMDVALYHDWTWQESGTLSQKMVPWGIRRILLYVKGIK